jgi:hypothetical protein
MGARRRRLWPHEGDELLGLLQPDRGRVATELQPVELASRARAGRTTHRLSRRTDALCPDRPPSCEAGSRLEGKVGERARRRSKADERHPAGRPADRPEGPGAAAAARPRRNLRRPPADAALARAIVLTSQPENTLNGPSRAAAPMVVVRVAGRCYTAPARGAALALGARAACASAGLIAPQLAVTILAASRALRCV